MPEKVRRGGRCHRGAHVEREERTRGPGAGRDKRRRHHSLAGAGLAAEQNRHVEIRDAVDLPPDIVDGVARPDQTMVLAGGRAQRTDPMKTKDDAAGESDEDATVEIARGKNDRRSEWRPVHFHASVGADGRDLKAIAGRGEGKGRRSRADVRIGEGLPPSFFADRT